MSVHTLGTAFASCPVLQSCSCLYLRRYFPPHRSRSGGHACALGLDNRRWVVDRVGCLGHCSPPTTRSSVASRSRYVSQSIMWPSGSPLVVACRILSRVSASIVSCIVTSGPRAESNRATPTWVSRLSVRFESALFRGFVVPSQFATPPAACMYHVQRQRGECWTCIHGMHA